jgi:hypothetical protein
MWLYINYEVSVSVSFVSAIVGKAVKDLYLSCPVTNYTTVITILCHQLKEKKREDMYFWRSLFYKETSAELFPLDRTTT